MSELIIMEQKLAKLVFKLVPKNKTKEMTRENIDFEYVMSILRFPANIQKADENLTFKIVTKYMFSGLETRLTGGSVAVYVPVHWVYRGDRSLKRGNGHYVGLKKFQDIMKKFTGCDVVKIDIPDIEEIKTKWMSMYPQELKDAGSVWIIKK